jgi:hypothetical protein
MKQTETPANDAANPKDAAGRAKLPTELWPPAATLFGCVGLLEGRLKYGRNNWRATPVYASVYFAAARRHLDAWFDGEDNTAEGGPHLGNALACIAILVDAQTHGTLIDDRNYYTDPQALARLTASLTEQANALKSLFADRDPKHWDRRDVEVANG